MKLKPHIRKNGNQSYKKKIRINGRRIAKRFSRIADAESWYHNKKREKELVESGLQAPSDLVQVKLSTYADSWLEKRKQQGKPQGSWFSDFERLKKWVRPLFGERVLQRISTQEFVSGRASE